MSSARPSIAVVVPLHNGARWIRDTLASVQAQTHPPAEIVVVDDHSTDDGPARAAAVLGVTVRPLTRPSVGGAGPGRQAGLEHTTAPLVAFLDQDDLWHPDHLRRLTDALRDRPDAPAAVAGLSVFDDASPPAYDIPPPALATLDPWASFPLNDILSPSGVLVRRTALDAIGGWPTDGAVTDFLAWFRLSVAHPFVTTGGMTCAKRRHAASKSVDLTTGNRSLYLQYRDALLRPLLAERRRHHPETINRLTARLAALRALGQLAAAVESERGATAGAPAAPALEALAEAEPHMFDRLAAFVVQFLCGPALRGREAHRQAVLDAFFSSWPASAPRAQHRLGVLFAASLSLWSILAFLRRGPLSPARWGLTVAAVRRVLRQGWTRPRPHIATLDPTA